MVPRFLAPELGDGVFALPPEESNHATRVLRLRCGDEILVFDGHGRQVRASVERIERDVVRVRALEPAQAAPEPDVRLTLIQAALKSAAMDEVVRNATMMGVSRIQPVVSARSQGTLTTLSRRGSVTRWRRIAISAAKQSGRAVVPDIRAPEALEVALADAGPETTVRVLLVEPAVQSTVARSARTITGNDRPPAAVVAVGPEGGWTRAEVEDAASRGFIPLRLGRRVLRADAVSLAAIAVLQFLWGDL